MCQHERYSQGYYKISQYKDTSNMYLLGRIDVLIICVTPINKISTNLSAHSVKNISSTENKSSSSSPL